MVVLLEIDQFSQLSKFIMFGWPIGCIVWWGRSFGEYCRQAPDRDRRFVAESTTFPEFHGPACRTDRHPSPLIKRNAALPPI